MKFSSRNIAFNRASVVAVITVAVGLAVSFGFIPAADQDAVLSAANGVVMAVFAVIAAVQVLVGFFVHKKVTPVADPKADDGTPLAPVAAPVVPPAPPSVEAAPPAS